MAGINQKMILVAVIAVVVTGYIFLSGRTHGYSHPSDTKMTDEYNVNKDRFASLVETFLEDAKDKSIHYWIGRENWTLERLSDARKQRYLDLFQQLNVRSIGFEREDRDVVRLLVSLEDKSVDDGYEVDIKGYSYSPSKIPPRLVHVGETDFWGNGNRRINDDWYVFHELMCCGPGE